MGEIRQRQPSLLFDFLIVAVAATLVLVSHRLGLVAGQSAAKGFGAVFGGVYLVYLGLLFLLSYYFSHACHVFTFLRFICETCSRPAGRQMAFFYFGLCLLLGFSFLLIGLGVL